MNCNVLIVSRAWNKRLGIKIAGKYLTVTGIVKKIDSYNQIIQLADNTQIPINEIIDISGDFTREKTN